MVNERRDEGALSKIKEFESNFTIIGPQGKVKLKVPTNYVNVDLEDDRSVSTAEEETTGEGEEFTLIGRNLMYDTFTAKNGDVYKSEFKQSFWILILSLISHILILYFAFFSKKENEEDEL